MFYQLVQYFKFLTKSTNQHGVHSPFVYQLVTQCFYDKHNYANYKNLVNFKNTLLKNHSIISLTDLGAGSHVTKKQNRTISKIAKQSGTSLKRAKLLFRISNYFKPTTILELGTSLGIATQALSLGNQKASITTIEGCPNISEFTHTNFKKLQLKNINLITGNFIEVINKRSFNSLDLIFFDGNHQKDATLQYFETLLQTAHNDSVFIFDDIYWSKPMTEAWEIIKAHPKVTVTIDTFYWGFVFFRKEQPKEHFVIRC